MRIIKALLWRATSCDANLSGTLRIVSPTTKIILISESVHEGCCTKLKEAGIAVLNECDEEGMVPLPSRSRENEDRFRRVFARLLTRVDM